ncbi:hypothetical protein L218DRAFT_941236 [Marasmius fiardii PR-910]|nr:hypothetical protein L218DRAFT_941236 [Marasmius fiardii PR-910]
MFASFITVALFAAAAVAEYTVDTPQLTQCQNATITWKDAQGSVNLIAVPASDVCNGNILADLGDHDGSSGSTSWQVDVPAGTKLVFTTLDASDKEAWSGEITVQPSNDDSCVRAEYKAASLLPSSSASSDSASASSSSSSSAPGTLVVTPTAGASTSYSSPNSNSNGNTNSGGPVGGVASDPLSKNGALTHATKPMLILGAISAVLAASL